MIFSALGSLLLITARAEPAGDDAQALIKIQHEWAAARVAGDDAYLEKLYAKDFRITTLAGTVVERDEDIALFATKTLVPEFVRDDDMDVRLYGDTAVVTGREHMKGVHSGHAGEFIVRFTNVYVREDGRWRLVAHHSTEIR